jgi:predicted  nucleic acid-binding Zn-ribbon protein
LGRGQLLQHHVKALDQLLSNMADIDDMVDDLDDAAKKAGKADDWQAAACRQARAFKALQPILIAAMQQSDRVESQLSDFLKTAPKLAKRLAHWQAANP